MTVFLPRVSSCALKFSAPNPFKIFPLKINLPVGSPTRQEYPFPAQEEDDIFNFSIESLGSNNGSPHSPSGSADIDPINELRNSLQQSIEPPEVQSESTRMLATDRLFLPTLRTGSAEKDEEIKSLEEFYHLFEMLLKENNPIIENIKKEQVGKRTSEKISHSKEKYLPINLGFLDLFKLSENSSRRSPSPGRYESLDEFYERMMKFSDKEPLYFFRKFLASDYLKGSDSLVAKALKEAMELAKLKIDTKSYYGNLAHSNISNSALEKEVIDRSNVENNSSRKTEQMDWLRDGQNSVIDFIRKLDAAKSPPLTPLRSVAVSPTRNQFASGFRPSSPLYGLGDPSGFVLSPNNTSPRSFSPLRSPMSPAPSSATSPTQSPPLSPQLRPTSSSGSTPTPRSPRNKAFRGEFY